MKLQKILIFITFVMGILFALSFAFNLIPEETYLRLQEYLQFDLEEYLSKLTMYSGTGLGVGIAGTLARATNERSDKLYGLRIRQQDEIYNKSMSEFKSTVEVVQQKATSEIELKQRELDLEKEKNALFAEKEALAKQRAKEIGIKNYFGGGHD